MIVTWKEIGLCHIVWWIVVQRTLTATETVATAMLLLAADHRFGEFGVTLSHRASAVTGVHAAPTVQPIPGKCGRVHRPRV